MPRRIAGLLILAALCAAVALPASASAGVAANRAALSKTEYRHLLKEAAAIKRFFHSTPTSWNPAYAACREVGASTALLRSVRAGCNAGIGLDVALTNFFADFSRCSALSTTTTGTTTTGTGTITTGTTTTGTTTTGTTTTGTTTLSGTGLRVIACLNPEYQVISRSARVAYQAAASMRARALARGFVGLCLRTLAPTPAELRLERRFATTSRQLAVDVSKLTKVASGTAPITDVNLRQIKTDGAAFDRSAQILFRTQRPQKLSVCPHR